MDGSVYAVTHNFEEHDVGMKRQPKQNRRRRTLARKARQTRSRLAGKNRFEQLEDRMLLALLPGRTKLLFGFLGLSLVERHLAQSGHACRSFGPRLRGCTHELSAAELLPNLPHPRPSRRR